MKTENEYQDGNDLIAIFLGGELHGSYYKFPEGVCPPLNSIARDNGIGTSRVMNFHADWHWLMQPVLKIINHKYTDGDTAYLRTFGMKNEIGNYMVRFNRCPLFEGYTLGEALWDAVIDFIKDELMKQQNNKSEKSQLSFYEKNITFINR